MTRVDFYVLPDARPQGREQLACRLADKALATRQSVLIATGDAGQTRLLDNLLWTWRDTSFLPHCILPDDNADQTAIALSDGPQPDQQIAGRRDILINLQHDAPATAAQFDRIIEIVDASEQHSRSGRTRFRYYRQQDFDINTHKLD